MTTRFITNDVQLKGLPKFLESFKLPFAITVKQGRRRSLQQNSYLWGVCYPVILSQGELEGWRAEDLHEYLKGEWGGWETLEGFGRKRMRPIHGSSTLTKTEFADFVAFIQEKAAGLGIYIPDPNET